MVKIPGGYCFLAVLPCNSIVHIELAFLDFIFKGVDHGAVAWFMLVCLVEPLDTRGHVVLLLVGSLGMPRFTVGMICVPSLLMYLNYQQYHKSVKLSIRSNYCQVVHHQVNENIGYNHQIWLKYRQLDEYLSKGCFRSSISPYGAHI